LYFAKNSKGYSPEWIQFIKNSISQIAPNYTMSRMMKDYIDRFYSPEAARSKKLRANDYALVREIVAWKEHVAENWDNVTVEDMQLSDSFYDISVNDGKVEATVKLNTAGLKRSVGLELVVYNDVDGETKFHSTLPMKVVEEDGDILTYKLNDRIKDTGIFRLSFRAFPWNNNLPHRQDFAYVKWF
jgi:starch phosphorylase